MNEGKEKTIGKKRAVVSNALYIDLPGTHPTEEPLIGAILR